MIFNHFKIEYRVFDPKRYLGLIFDNFGIVQSSIIEGYFCLSILSTPMPWPYLYPTTYLSTLPRTEVYLNLQIYFTMGSEFEYDQFFNICKYTIDSFDGEFWSIHMKVSNAPKESFWSALLPSKIGFYCHILRVSNRITSKRSIQCIRFDFSKRKIIENWQKVMVIDKSSQKYFYFLILKFSIYLVGQSKFLRDFSNLSHLAWCNI